MLTAQKAEQLHGFLASLPESLALRLAKAVEVDRLAEGKLLPHEMILDGLRPVLRRAAKVERTPAPARMFCAPFEDLLSSGERKQKQKGRIGRSSIPAVWNWLAQTLLPQETALYYAQSRDAVLSFRLDDAAEIAAAFHAKAGEAIKRALGDDAQRKEARLALGGELMLADADEIALMLGNAAEIAEIQSAMPRPQPQMNEELLWTLRSIYDRLVVSSPDAAPYVAVIAMNRLERPWEALRLPLMVARQTQDTLISSTDMGLVGELLLAELDAHALVIRSVKQPVFDAEELVGHLAGFAMLSNGIAKEVEMKRDSRWGQRLMKDRAGVAELMDTMMKRGPREILSAIPTLKSGAYAGGPRVPDLSRALDAEKGGRAINYARLIAGCRPLAAAAAFAASLGEASTEVTTALKSYCEDIVRELRAAEGEKRERVEQYFALAAELTTILLSVEEGEYLKRRGRAAMNAAQAA